MVKNFVFYIFNEKKGCKKRFLIKFLHIHIEKNDEKYAEAWFPLSQWSEDNVDHNVSSLNGKGVLHEMGVVVLSTCLSDHEARKLPSLRAIPGQKLKKASDVVQEKDIPILQYEIPEESGLSKLMFKKMSEITFPSLQPKDLNLDKLLYGILYALIINLNQNLVQAGVSTC